MSANNTNIATRLALVKVIKDELGKHETEWKDQVLDLFDPGDRKTASIDGNQVGSVTVADPKDRAVIDDDAAFLTWVQNNHPDEVVHTVRDSFKKAVLADVLKSGEMPDGVTIRPGSPYVSVRVTAEQRDTLVAAVRDGHIQVGDLLAIEGAQ